jgi:hypothetical protein
VVNLLQTLLGDVLLVLAGLAVVLLAVVLLLCEVDLILRLGRKLARRLGPNRPDPGSDDTQASQDPAVERVPEAPRGR